MAKSIGIHFFEFEDMFRCYRDNENLKKHFGHMDTFNSINKQMQQKKPGKVNENIFPLYGRLIHALS